MLGLYHPSVSTSKSKATLLFSPIAVPVRDCVCQSYFALLRRIDLGFVFVSQRRPVFAPVPFALSARPSIGTAEYCVWRPLSSVHPFSVTNAAKSKTISPSAAKVIAGKSDMSMQSARRSARLLFVFFIFSSPFFFEALS